MKPQTNIFILSFFLAVLTIRPAAALSDSANLALDKLEMVTNKLEELEQLQLSIEKGMEQVKSGVMGKLDMLKSFGKQLKNFDIKKIKGIVKSAAGLADKLDNKEKTSDAVEELMVPTYGKGKDSDVAYEQKRKRMELLQNNVAALYGHALAIRAEISAKEDGGNSSASSESSSSGSDSSASSGDGEPATTENVRQLIALNREALVKINRKYNDILMLEARLLEFEATNVMTTFSKVADDEETEEKTEGDKQ